MSGIRSVNVPVLKAVESLRTTLRDRGFSDLLRNAAGVAAVSALALTALAVPLAVHVNANKVEEAGGAAAVASYGIRPSVQPKMVYDSIFLTGSGGGGTSSGPSSSGHTAAGASISTPKLSFIYTPNQPVFNILLTGLKNPKADTFYITFCPVKKGGMVHAVLREIEHGNKNYILKPSPGTFATPPKWVSKASWSVSVSLNWIRYDRTWSGTSDN